MQGASRIALVQRTGKYTHAATVDVPRHEPGQRTPQKLIDIRRDLSSTTRAQGEQFNIKDAVTKITDLRILFQDHKRVRPLLELEAVYANGQSIHDALEADQERFKVQLERVKRLRNAAIHGGPVSETACLSVAVFAHNLALQCLNAVIRSILNDEDVQTYIDTYRSENSSRYRAIRSNNHYSSLFVDSPTRGVRKATFKS